MDIIRAFGSALFAGLTSILAKCGIKKTDSTVATAVRTIVVLFMSYMMVLIIGSQDQIVEIGTRTWVFLILSGLATGAFLAVLFQSASTGRRKQSSAGG